MIRIACLLAGRAPVDVDRSCGGCREHLDDASRGAAPANTIPSAPPEGSVDGVPTGRGRWLTVCDRPTRQRGGIDHHGSDVPDKWERLVDALAGAEGWTTAATLAARLDVTPRTIRSYVARANQGGRTLIESGPEGYRLDRAVWAERVAAGTATAHEGSPAARLARLIRDLVEAPDGLDLHAAAAELHVSDSTIEADLGRVRTRLDGTGVHLRRDGSIVRLEGPESAMRRLISALVREEGDRGVLGFDELRRSFPAMDGFRDELVAALDDAGYAPNEFTLDDVLLHLAIALDRIGRDRHLGDRHVTGGGPADAAWGDRPDDDRLGSREPVPGRAARQAEPLAGLVGELVVSHFGRALDAAELDHIARLVGTRAATRRVDAAPGRAAGRLSPRAAVLEQIVRRISADYLVDLGDDEFIDRLALHVDNLAARAADRSYSRNPLTAAIKSAYPLIYDLAVYLASELGRLEGITVNDDEIAYLAMHLGAHLERTRARGESVRVGVAVPAYHDARTMLMERLRAATGDDVEFVAVGPAASAAPGADVELLVAVLPPTRPHPNTIVIGPFPTEADLERVRSELSRIRLTRRRARLAATLSRTTGPELFVRGMRGRTRDDVIRMLGDRMIAAGLIDDAYVEGALERERMSSTVFTELLAVPHAMTMTATRSAIAFAIDDVPIDWGGSRVHVVALIAFAESGRAEFQEVFDQFVEAFSEPENVRRLVRGAVDYGGLLTELAHLMSSP
jgi:lichenan operon transcriptional antiterminator